MTFARNHSRFFRRWSLLLLAALATLFGSLGIPARLLAQAQLGLPQTAEQIMLPTTPEQLFRVESEDRLKERMTREYLAIGQKKVLFPREAAPPFADNNQQFPPATAFVEHANLCSNPLYFEDVKTERYGLYCPLIQPLLSTSRFYLDTLSLPIKMVLDPPWTLVPLPTP